MHRLHLQIYGRVQGVAFRAFASREARSRRITGWVRNQRDGSVELLAEGTRESLERLEACCHDGPPSADVYRVESEWLVFIGDLGPFAIKYG